MEICGAAYYIQQDSKQLASIRAQPLNPKPLLLWTDHFEYPKPQTSGLQLGITLNPKPLNPKPLNPES